MRLYLLSIVQSQMSLSAQQNLRHTPPFILYIFFSEISMWINKISSIIFTFLIPSYNNCSIVGPQAEKNKTFFEDPILLPQTLEIPIFGK